MQVGVTDNHPASILFGVLQKFSLRESLSTAGTVARPSSFYGHELFPDLDSSCTVIFDPYELAGQAHWEVGTTPDTERSPIEAWIPSVCLGDDYAYLGDRKSTRLNSSH